MFNSDFFPTPNEVIEDMLFGFDVRGKVILEPSAGKGNIVDQLLQSGAAKVLACEIHPELRKILSTKCELMTADFLKLTSDQVSHIDFIVMNPPFSCLEKHLLHAWEIAPAGCQIISLCSTSLFESAYSQERKQISDIVLANGTKRHLGRVFEKSERPTSVDITLIHLLKPGENADDFEGFFLEEDEEPQSNGIMPYNVIRDLVNRYVQALKIYDKHLQVSIEMNTTIGAFYKSAVYFKCTQGDEPLLRADFKKNLQKDAWMYIFKKLDLEKYVTKGVKEDINRFIEKQTHIPFTMRNVYRMLEIIVGTQESRMNQAIIEVFDKLTMHTHENRYNVEGWKTNSHYYLNSTFIMPNLCEADRWHKGPKLNLGYHSNFDKIEDMMKAICFITNENYEKYGSLRSHIDYDYQVQQIDKIEYFTTDIHYGGANARAEKLRSEGKQANVVRRPDVVYNKWFDWAFFEIKAFKKGTMHFRFKDLEVWAKFNQHVAKIKGYPLPESRPQTPKKQKEYEREQKQYEGQELRFSSRQTTSQPVGKQAILFEMEV